MTDSETRIARWYFGGLASAGAACCTHPLDLLKVQMQTKKGKNISMFKVARIVIRNEGILGLYNGISASLLRQLTYSTARFGIYESAKQHFAPRDGTPLPFYMSAFLAGLGGLAGGFVGNPADLVNVRMQNDVKLPKEQRRKTQALLDQSTPMELTPKYADLQSVNSNALRSETPLDYKNALHGLWCVARSEGLTRLWVGATMTCSRAVLMTIGQLSFYDSIKRMLLATPYFVDNVITHVVSSLAAGAIATTLTQPVDVLKTRAMNAKPGEVKSILNLVLNTGKEGPLAYFKGYIPAFARLAPQTILTFVFLEQLRINFGVRRLTP